MRERGRGKEGNWVRGRRGHHTTPPPPHKAANQHREVQPAREGREEPEEEPEEKETERPHGGPGQGHLRGGGRYPPRGKCGSPGIPPRTCAPVVAGSLWRLPASQQWVAPGRGNIRRRCMAASLAPDCCTISELVRHALWSGGASLHGNLGSEMEGGFLTELEL